MNDFPRSRASKPKSSLLALFLIAPISLSPGTQFYASHIFFFLFLLFIALHRAQKKISPTPLIYGTIFSIVFLLGIFSAHYNSPGDRVINDSIKLIYYAMGISVAITYLKLEDVRLLLSKIILVFPLVFLIVISTYGELFTYSGRLFTDQTGSPNVLGVAAALSLMFILYEKENLFGHTAKPILILFYTTLLVLTASRAAILAFLISYAIYCFGFIRSIFASSILLIILFFISPYMSHLADSLSLPALHKFDLWTDLNEKGGSYRLDIWAESISQWANNSSAWLFGYGPGKVIMYLYGENDGAIYHPHNTFLFFLYSFGLFGFFAFTIGLTSFLATAATRHPTNRPLHSFITFYLVIFFFDTHLTSSQFLVFHSLFICMLFLYTINSRSGVITHQKREPYE